MIAIMAPSSGSSRGLELQVDASASTPAMAKLSLYIDPRGVSVLHRSGFSWLAAFALPLWALHRRLWRTFLASLPLTAALNALANAAIEWLPGETAQAAAALAWLLGWSWAAGRYSNHWHRHVLERAGYRMTATELPLPKTA